MRTQGRKLDKERTPAGSVSACRDIAPALLEAALAPKRSHREPDTRLIRAGLARIGAALLSLFISVAMVHAQSYSTDWFTIDGGGGTSIQNPNLPFSTQPTKQ